MNYVDERESLKAAVGGVGAMGQHHARVYDQMLTVRLVGVADIDSARSERVAQLRHTVAYVDYRRLLDVTQPDIVTVAVPTYLHHLVAMDALAAGCHVLVEKPIAATVEQARELIERANVLRRKLMVGHIVRFDPAVRELKRRLEAGELGRIFQVRCRRLGPFPGRIRDVGVVIDLATHDLDTMRYLTGQEPVQVYAETERGICSAHEDIFVGTVRFEDGTIGMLDINWLTPTKVRELTVTGERGMFLVNHLTQDLYFYENAEVNSERWDAISLLRGVSEGRMIRYPVHKREPLRAELEAFVQSVIDDEPVPVSGEDGLAALRLALALVRSGREGHVLSMSDDQS